MILVLLVLLGNLMGINTPAWGSVFDPVKIFESSSFQSAGDMLYYDGAQVRRLPRGTVGQCLTSSATTILWSSCIGSISLTSQVSGVLPLANGGTNNDTWTAGDCVRVHASGTRLESAGAPCGSGGGGGGDNISVNGSGASDADFDDATPSAPAGGLNILWQKDTSTPNNISAYLKYAAPLGIDTGNLTITGTVGPLLGGTGTATTATVGRYLRGDGSNWVTSSVAAGGAGSCTNQFVRATVDNAAPTCASVSLSTDVSGALGLGSGGTGVTSALDDEVLVSNGTVWQAKQIPNCAGTTDKLLYDTATNAFSCGTDQGGAGSGLDHPAVMSRVSLGF